MVFHQVFILDNAQIIASDTKLAIMKNTLITFEYNKKPLWRTTRAAFNKVMDGVATHSPN